MNGVWWFVFKMFALDTVNSNLIIPQAMKWQREKPTQFNNFDIRLVGYANINANMKTSIFSSIFKLAYEPIRFACRWNYCLINMWLRFFYNLKSKSHSSKNGLILQTANIIIYYLRFDYGVWECHDHFLLFDQDLWTK